MWTVAQVLARIGKPYFAPGRGYHYSNTNYILLGVVIEKVTGKTIASLVRSEFLDPLGMKNTWFQPEEKAPITNFAHGYMNSASKPRDVSIGQTMLPYNSEATVAWTSGGFVSTASDLARWASALYGGGVLDEAELASMTDVSPTLPYTNYPYGYGFEGATIDKQMAWGHRGHLDGFWSAMWYLPDYGITIVILTNDEWTVKPRPWARAGADPAGQVAAEGTPAGRTARAAIDTGSPKVPDQRAVAMIGRIERARRNRRALVLRCGLSAGCYPRRAVKQSLQ